MKYNFTTSTIFTVLMLTFSSFGYAANYSPGASDKEIKIGNTGPYTGPAASYSQVLKVIEGYFKMLNEKGGINGRQIKFISYDDQYDPKQTQQQVKKLIEKDQVLFTLFTIGTPSNLAIRGYMNEQKVPQLFTGSGAYFFNEPLKFPWTNPGVPDYIGEASLYAQYILKQKPYAKVALLWQDDDYGRIYLTSFLKTLGDKSKSIIIAQESYNVKDEDISAQMKALKESGADTFVNISTPRFATQAIDAMAEMNWKPLHLAALRAVSRENVFAKVGFEKVQGLLSAQATKDPADKHWANDADMKAYKEFMKKYAPDLDPNDVFIIAGYLAAALTEEILKRCGDDLTHENIMKIRNELDFNAPLLLPGIHVKISPQDLRFVKEMYMAEFRGDAWHPVGEPLSFDQKPAEK